MKTTNKKPGKPKQAAARKSLVAKKPTVAKKVKKPAAKPSRPAAVAGKSLAKRIADGRSERNWSQVKLAKQSELSQGYICDLERGRKQPSIDAVRKIARAFGVTIGSMLDD
jgi:ribosome-binding protein aMBF1 (putative translation factor)